MSLRIPKRDLVKPPAPPAKNADLEDVKKVLAESAEFDAGVALAVNSLIGRLNTVGGSLHKIETAIESLYSEHWRATVVSYKPDGRIHDVDFVKVK